MHKELLRVGWTLADQPVDHAELTSWGSMVTKKFVLDNMLAVPMGYILATLSEEDLCKPYVGIHTFSDALSRG